MGSFGRRVASRAGIQRQSLAAALVMAFAGLAALAGCAQGHATTGIAQAGTVLGVMPSRLRNPKSCPP